MKPNLPSSRRRQAHADNAGSSATNNARLLTWRMEMTKTPKALPILLDRLEHALKKQGLDMKRSQLLEIAAGAFGYRNSNELTAAAKDGNINPPSAVPVGTLTLPDGQRIIVVIDDLAKAPYAIDESFLEQIAAEDRRETIGVTPYGHLARLDRILDFAVDDIETADPSEKTSRIFVGLVTYKDGINVYLAPDNDGIIMQVATYVRENWDDISEYDDEFESPDWMSDSEVVETFFDTCANYELGQYLDISQEDVVARIIPQPEIAKQWPDRYFIDHEMDNEPIYLRDRHSLENGRGQIVAEIKRTGFPQKDISLAEEIIGRLNGNIIEEKIPGKISQYEVLQLAKELEEGAVADIFYHAHDFGDNAAEKTIDNTQSAMQKAAAILRDIADKETSSSAMKAAENIVSPDKDKISKALKEQEKDPVWITGPEANYTGRVTFDDVTALGLDVDTDAYKKHPLTEGECKILGGGMIVNTQSQYPARLGFSVLYKNAKWFAPEVSFNFEPESEMERLDALERAKDFIEEKTLEVTALGGMLYLTEDEADDEHAVAVLLPFSLSEDAANIGCFHQAIAWLLLHNAEKPEGITARFIPEVDMNGHVYPADPKGDDTWDATFDALMWGKDFAQNIVDGLISPDDFVLETTLAPQWTRQWAELNPFTVEVSGIEKMLERGRKAFPPMTFTGTISNI